MTHSSGRSGSTAPDWNLEPYAAEDGSRPFEAFLDDLDDFTFAALDAALRHVLGRRGIDLARTEWLKPLGDGLHEFRVRHAADEIERMFCSGDADAATNALSPPTPVLLRVFVHFYGERVVLLLAGYDKGEDPSRRRQDREIARARKLLTAWDEQRKREKKAARRRKS